jgi:hypothetical protein
VLRLLADENFNSEIVRGLLLRHGDLEILRVQDVGLAGADDRQVLAWAADNGCIVLTHDRATMPAFAWKRVAAGEPMPGLFLLNDRLPVGLAIQEMLLVASCTEQAEWKGRVAYLPL